LTRADEKQVQLKLLKALKIVKSIAKVDLRECEITCYDFWEVQLSSALKKISHVKTLCVEGSRRDSEAKSFKHFANLKNLRSELQNFLYPFHTNEEGLGLLTISSPSSTVPKFVY